MQSRIIHGAKSFQSAPLTEARGDRLVWYDPLTEARGDYLMFQSAPLTEARGDCELLSYAVSRGRVSIRSPHRSKGRLL